MVVKKRIQLENSRLRLITLKTYQISRLRDPCKKKVHVVTYSRQRIAEEGNDEIHQAIPEKEVPEVGARLVSAGQSRNGEAQDYEIEAHC